MKHRFTCITTNKPPCWKAWEPSLQLRFFRCPCMSLRLGRSWSVFAQVRWCAWGEGEMLSWKNQRFRKTPLNISRCGLFVNRRVSTFVKFTLLSLKHAPPSFLSTPTPNSSFCSGPNFSKLSRRTREEMLAKSFLLSWKLASLVHRNTNKVPRTRSHKTTAKLI